MPDPQVAESHLAACLASLVAYESRLATNAPLAKLALSLPEFRDRLKVLLITFRRIVALVEPTFNASTGMFGLLIDEAADTLTIALYNTFLNPQAVDQKEQLDLELFAVTESFYQTAWRLLELTDAKTCDLPGLGGFDAKGVRFVRNHLIQHPDRADKARRLWSRRLGRSSGPALGGAYTGSPAPIFTDPGLYANAIEFAERLNARLTAALT